MPHKKLPKKQTGTPSSFGKRTWRTRLNPWGNVKRNRVVGRVNAQGQSTKAPFAGSKPRGSSQRKKTADPQLFGFRTTPPTPANDPAEWPLVDPATGLGIPKASPTAPTQAKADFNNDAVNHAYFRATGLS